MTDKFEVISEKEIPLSGSGFHGGRSSYAPLFDAFSKLAEGEAIRMPYRTTQEAMRSRSRVYQAFRNKGYREAYVALRGTDLYVIKRRKQAEEGLL